MYIKCWYLNTFLYIVLYNIHNLTLLKIQIGKLGESWKRRRVSCWWQTHGMEKLFPLENKSSTNGWSTTNTVGVNCFVKTSAHVNLLNSPLRGWINLVMDTEMWHARPWEQGCEGSHKFLLTLEWCGSLGWVALLPFILSGIAASFAWVWWYLS